MKKIILSAILFFVLTIVASCNSEVKPPENVTQEVWDLARDHMSLLDEIYKKAQPFIKNADFTLEEQEAYEKVYNLDIALFEGYASEILYDEDDTYTDEEFELILKVYQLDMTVIRDIPMPEEYIDHFVTQFNSIKKEIELGDKEIKDRLKKLYALVDNGDKAVTKTAENYFKAIQAQDSGKMYDMINGDGKAEIEKEEYIANYEEFLFMSDYKLDEFKVLSVEKDEFGHFNYTVRVATRSTSTEGNESSILLVPVEFNLKEKQWIINIDELVEE